MKEIHLWHCGHVDLHLCVSLSLSKIFHCPFVQTRPEDDTSQHSWPALKKGLCYLSVYIRTVGYTPQLIIYDQK